MTSQRPLPDAGRKDPGRVRSMFDEVAPRYDLVNRVMSLRLDKRWRRQAVEHLEPQPGHRILDLGTGTGDLALRALGAAQSVDVVGVDLSRSMLAGARGKAPSEGGLHLLQASALDLPVIAGDFDGVLTAFTLRNVPDLPRVLREAHRALRPGGRFVSVEIHEPDGRVLGAAARFHLHHVMPAVGRVLSGQGNAYAYLSESIRHHPAPEEVARMLEDAGFQDVEVHRRLLGSIAIHVARKPTA